MSSYVSSRTHWDVMISIMNNDREISNVYTTPYVHTGLNA